LLLARSAQLKSSFLLPLLILLAAACSPQRDSTTLPTEQTMIDPVTKKLDAAAEQAQKRREEMEAAAKQ
jgi:hypothetical protein